MNWLPINNGKTVGTRGSEEGITVLDEEHREGARITLEKGGRTAEWSITCGIYGRFLHTAFVSSEADGRAKYSNMKADLEKIITEQDPKARQMSQFANVY